MPTTHPNLPVGFTFPVKLENPHTSPLLHNAPADSEYNKGIYRHRESGDKYALAIRKPNIYSRTHFLKNTAYSWEGTADEFNLTFEKA